MKRLMLTVAMLASFVSLANVEPRPCRTIDSKDCEVTMSPSMRAPPDEITVVPFGKEHIPRILETYRDNQFAFNRGFRGKRFDALMPYRSNHEWFEQGHYRVVFTGPGNE
jgi:hypothetical protein